MPKSPLGLPDELFVLIMKHCCVSDLWSMMGVCKEWRALLIHNSTLWCQLDVTMFKPESEQLGVQRFLELAGDTIQRLYCSGLKRYTLYQVQPSAEHLAIAQDSMEHLKQLLKRCPKLEDIVCHGTAVAAAILGAVKHKELLQKLRIADGLAGEFSDLQVITRFPCLQTLCLDRVKSRFLARPLHEMTWMNNSIVSLTRIELGSYGRRRFVRQIASLPFLKKLPTFAPNLEHLVLNSFYFGEKCGRLDLTGFARLKIFSASLMFFENLDFPLLPGSLEELSMLSDCRPTQHTMAPMPLADVPRLPKLRVLETNFDVPTATAARSLWYEVMTLSKCTLETLHFERDIWYLDTNPTISAFDPILASSYQTTGFSTRLTLRLIQSGCLRGIRHLAVRSTKRNACTVQHLAWGIAANCPDLERLIWNGWCGLEAGPERALRLLWEKNSKGVAPGRWPFISEDRADTDSSLDDAGSE